MKNRLLTFYRKVNQQRVTLGLGSSKLVAKPSECVESIVVTYPRCRIPVLGLRYSSRNNAYNAGTVNIGTGFGVTGVEVYFSLSGREGLWLKGGGRVAHYSRPELP